MLLKKLVLFLLIFLPAMVFAQENSVLHDTQGNTIQMAQLKDKWIVVNYWAAWCPSCLKEIPELNHFYQHNQDKNVLLFSVNFDHLSTKSLKMAVDRVNINYPSLVEDPGYMWGLGDINFVPVTFIISPEGKLAKEFVGPVTERALLSVLETLKRQEA